MVFNSQPDPDLPINIGDQVPTEFGPFLKWIIIGAIVIALFLFLAFGRTIYTDWLWFGNLGFSSIFAKILVTRIVLFLLGASVFGIFLGISVFFAFRGSRGPSELTLPEKAIEFLNKLTVLGAVAVAVVISIVFGGVMSSRWEVFLKFTNAESFNMVDPLFGKDGSFFVFTLPMLDFVQGWLLGAAIVILLATLGLYFLRYTLRGKPFEFSNGVKIHLSVIAAVVLIFIAGGHWLDRWSLVLSPDGAVFGAAYADVHARKPALLVLTIIALGSSALMLVNAYVRGLRLLVGAVALWIVMAIVLGSVWPALVQQFTVTPNEFAREEPYINRNLDFTRFGFALDRIEERFYPAEAAVTAEAIQDNLLTINNIRLWDARPLSNVYRQIQLIRAYYDFKDADVDRYMLGGQIRQVLLSAREVAPEKLDPQAQTWVNTRLVYTHGIGIAMSPVTEFTPEGRPAFFAQDIPPDGVIPISFGDNEPEIIVSNPRIYYGENTLDYVIVNTNAEEIDYQTKEGELFHTRYFGSGGVSLDSFFKRLAYAWQLGDVNIFISGEITGESRIQYRRAIQERISTVAPFLLLDRDPYIVATGEEFFWVQDAYTISDHFPYSDPFGTEFNYIRNSVKVTVDAFNGTVKFYVWDETDPIIATYAKIFPELFSPKESLSAEIQSHIRYPQDFFSIQAEKYLRYHQKDPQNFYNNEDLWAIPNEKFGQSDNLQVVEPYYLVMKLPGEESEEFMLLMPFTPAQRQNLVGWLAARSDGENYGTLVAFNFPKDRQVDGTEQVEARIDNDQDISAWFTLRCSQGSFCIRGNLLVIPIGDTLLYVEPVYIQAEGVTFPELKKVILASGEKVVMEDSLDEALAALVGSDFSFASRTGQSSTSGQSPQGGQSPGFTGTALSEFENLESFIEEIRENLSALEEALGRLKDISGGE